MLRAVDWEGPLWIQGTNKTLLDFGFSILPSSLIPRPDLLPHPDPPASPSTSRPSGWEGEAVVGEKILTYLVNSRGSFRRASMLISQKSFFLWSYCPFLNYGRRWQNTDSFQPKPHASPNTCANTHTHTHTHERERERERERMSFFQRLAEWEKWGCQNKNQGS